MSYLVGVKLPSGEIVHRLAENISDLSYVTDDGETLCVVHDQDDFHSRRTCATRGAHGVHIGDAFMRRPALLIRGDAAHCKARGPKSSR
jgi:hypothetical protein